MRRTRCTFRHLFFDWRSHLILALLFGLIALSLTIGISKEYRYRNFYEKARFAIQPDYAAGYLGLEGDFESFEQVWATYVDSPNLAEYYYLSALCNASLAGTLASILLSFWIIGRCIQERYAAELVMHGASRGAAFLQLFFPYFFANIILRWGFFALCFAIMPIHTEYFSSDYFQVSVLCWLLLSAADTAFFAFTAFAFHPFIAIGADLGVAALVLILPNVLRHLMPLSALNDKSLWMPEAFPGSLYTVAIVGGVLLLSSVCGSFLTFRNRDFL